MSILDWLEPDRVDFVVVSSYMIYIKFYQEIKIKIFFVDVSILFSLQCSLFHSPYESQKKAHFLNSYNFIDYGWLQGF